MGLSTQRESLLRLGAQRWCAPRPDAELAGPTNAHGLRGAARTRHRRRGAPDQRSPAGPDVLGPQGAVATRPLRPRPSAESAGRAVPRHRRLVVAEPARRRPHDRGRQRRQDAAHGRPTSPLGRRPARLLQRPGGGPATHRGLDGPFPTTRGLAPLVDGTPVAAVMGDSHAALFAHAGWRPGRVKATYGTGSSIMSLGYPGTTTSPALCLTVAWDDGQPAYAFEGNIRASGATLTWLAELFGMTPDAVASAAADSSDGVHLVPGFGGLGAPWWDDDAVGLLTGLSFGTRLPQVARAGPRVDRFPGGGRGRGCRTRKRAWSKHCSPMAVRPRIRSSCSCRRTRVAASSSARSRASCRRLALRISRATRRGSGPAMNWRRSSERGRPSIPRSPRTLETCGVTGGTRRSRARGERGAAPRPPPVQGTRGRRTVWRLPSRGNDAPRRSSGVGPRGLRMQATGRALIARRNSAKVRFLPGALPKARLWPGFFRARVLSPARAPAAWRSSSRRPCARCAPRA